jgi:isopentenyl-diphosphate Delta-isomerase
MNDNYIVLVDEQDKAVGTVEKLAAHQLGYLHRAFSIFIIDQSGNMLLQQRALDKYHSGGLWTNACCSHPTPGETVEAAALRRLQEEMGFQCPLHKVFEFTYCSKLDNGLIEHEYDHVLLGVYDGIIFHNPAEVNDYQYKSLPEITKALEQSPEMFTTWFQLSFHKVVAHLGKIKQLLK